MKKAMFKMGRLLKRLGYLPIKILLATSVISFLVVFGVLSAVILLLFSYVWSIQGIFAEKSMLSKVEELFSKIEVALNKYSGDKNE